MNRKMVSEWIVEVNENWVAVNKPSGLLSVPDRQGNQSLRCLLQEHFGNIFTVHRLDKETSGLILFARSEAAHKYLNSLFEQRKIEKSYFGLVAGSLSEKKGTVNAPVAMLSSGKMAIHPKGKPSLTEYEVLNDYGLFSFVRFRIFTGRTHQIRIHMKHVGHPIVADTLYGNGKPLFVSELKKDYKRSLSAVAEKPILGRLALHAHRLAFTDVDGQNKILEAPLHKDMKAALHQLEKNSLSPRITFTPA
ncbi:MAG: RNA pseudouridine synthase [Chitinophagaceae bacterium]|nr:RNA pseudouridine synthase [Chitinophagaceae bacterium]